MLLSIAACGAQQAADAKSRSRFVFDEISTGKIASIVATMPPAKRTPQTEADLQAAAALIPPGDSTSFLLLGRRYTVHGSVAIVEVSDEYWYPGDKSFLFDTTFRYDHESPPELLRVSLTPVG
jgi:hypothetical protein